MDLTIRPARLEDGAAVRSFTEDTWPDHGGDYVPRVVESWVRDDGPDALTLVAAVDGRAVGLHRTVLLSRSEAWCSGMRVDPDYRGEGVAVRLARASFDWARERGATVARCLVFSWNAAGLGAARAAGFEPAAEFRWAHPEPAADGWRGGGATDVTRADATTATGATGTGTAGARDAYGAPDPDAAWSHWQGSAAFDHLGGLALDPDEPWALSSLTRARLVEAADDGRLLVVGGGRAGSGQTGGRRAVDGVEVGGVRGFGVRARVSERQTVEGEAAPERWAEYGVADWTDAEAAATVFDAIARDAAAVGADRTRVLIPETVRAVSDAALARVPVAEAPDFVLAADLRA